MRAVVQRIKRGRVFVEGECIASVEKGLLILLGVSREDTEKDAEYLARKIAGLRIFEDASQKLNASVKDIQGEILLVPNFTLYGDCRRGRRPSFDKVAPPAEAERLYEYLVTCLEEEGLRVQTGRFRAFMDVELINTGPVTILLDSKKIF